MDPFNVVEERYEGNPNPWSYSVGNLTNMTPESFNLFRSNPSGWYSQYGSGITTGPNTFTEQPGMVNGYYVGGETPEDIQKWKDSNPLYTADDIMKLSQDTNSFYSQGGQPSTLVSKLAGESGFDSAFRNWILPTATAGLSTIFMPVDNPLMNKAFGFLSSVGTGGIADILNAGANYIRGDHDLFKFVDRAIDPGGIVDYGTREFGKLLPDEYNSIYKGLGTAIGSIWGPVGAAAGAGIGSKLANEDYQTGFRNAGLSALTSYIMSGGAGEDFTKYVKPYFSDATTSNTPSMFSSTYDPLSAYRNTPRQDYFSIGEGGDLITNEPTGLLTPNNPYELEPVDIFKEHMDLEGTYTPWSDEAPDLSLKFKGLEPSYNQPVEYFSVNPALDPSNISKSFPWEEVLKTGLKLFNGFGGSASDGSGVPGVETVFPGTMPDMNPSDSTANFLQGGGLSLTKGTNLGAEQFDPSKYLLPPTLLREIDKSNNTQYYV